MKVLCILTDGFEELEAIGTIALLRRAGIPIDIYAVDHDQAMGRFQITVTGLLNSKDVNLNMYDALFIPGGPHYALLEDNPQVQTIIQHFFEHHKIVAAICAAPTILGRMGYLKDKQYTCFTSMNEDFKGTYIDRYVVVDDHLITGRSAAASIDFAFALIALLAGEKKAIAVKESIYY